jgi:hypothetical protein
MNDRSSEFQWFVVERWQEFGGEARANWLRMLALAAFYLVELVNYHGLRLGFIELPKVSGVDKPFHLAMTALTAGWTLSGWLSVMLLRQRVFPSSLKYVSTGLDLAFLTTMLLVADGPKSPLVVGYFLILCLAAIRFSLPLVRFATVGAVFGYLVLLANAAWFRPALRLPRYEQLIFVLALATAGVLLGQLLRAARAAAEDYARRLGSGCF